MSWKKESASSEYNILLDGKSRSIGIIASGVAYNYYREVSRKHNLTYPVLKISQYPLPVDLISSIAKNTDSLLVLEDGYPFIEEQLRGLLNVPFNVKGRLSGDIPRDGELNPDIISGAFGFKTPVTYSIPQIIENRPPVFCSGCGHADLFHTLNKAMDKYGKGKVFSDIGCYTLGALPPYEAIYSCVDMGASITMAKGAADAGLFPSVAVIGDSTFSHSGMTGLLEAVIENSPITVIISNNFSTGMTGGQTSPVAGSLESICKGIGVEQDHIFVIDPHKKYHEQNVAIIMKELEYKGLSVIIAQRECIRYAIKRKK